MPTAWRVGHETPEEYTTTEGSGVQLQMTVALTWTYCPSHGSCTRGCLTNRFISYNAVRVAGRNVRSVMSLF